MSHADLYRALHVVLDYLERHDADPTALADLALAFAHAERREGGVREMLRAGGWRAPPGVRRPKMSDEGEEWVAGQLTALTQRLAARWPGQGRWEMAIRAKWDLRRSRLSPEAEAARRPLPPEVLAQAEEQVIHPITGEGRPARVGRRNDGGDR